MAINRIFSINASNLWKPARLMVGIICLWMAVSVQPVDAAQGDLDVTFGENGIAYGALLGWIDKSAYISEYNNTQSMLLTEDDRIILAGVNYQYDEFGIYSAQFVAKFNPDGSVDSGFGTDGFLQNPVLGSGHAVQLDSQGRLIVGGSTPKVIQYYNYWQRTTSAPDSRNIPRTDFGLARYHPDGTLDITFGAAHTGNVITDFFGHNDEIAALFVVADDAQEKILAVGTARHVDKNRVALARYLADGTLDTTFGEQGKITTEFDLDTQVVEAILDDTGKLLVLGRSFTDGSSSGTRLIRYLPDGTVDATFGTNGTVTAPLNHPYQFTLDHAGNIVIVGKDNSFSYDSFVLTRYTPQGQLDTSFGDQGQVIHNLFTQSAEVGRNLIVDSQNRILVVGDLGQNPYAAKSAYIVRYTAQGTLDISFGNNGYSEIYVSYCFSDRWCKTFNQVALDQNNQIIVGGIDVDSSLNYASPYLMLARYQNEGAVFTQLIQNGGFEEAGASESEAAHWTTTNLPKSKRKCNPTNKPGNFHTISGECSFKVKGVEGITGKITQMITTTAIDGQLILSIDGWYSSANYYYYAYPKRLSAQVMYASGEVVKLKTTAPLDITQPIVSIRVLFKVKPADKGVVDNISLRHRPIESAADSSIPLPIVPLP